MMKAALSVLLLALLATGGPAFAERSEQQTGYQPDQVYSGIYKTGILYQYSPWKQLWYPSTEHRRWEDLNCRAALRDLSRRGTWVGNLSHSGDCLGKEEAPTWATGNYLNYKLGR